jgi:hypothetical protein
MFRDKMLSAYLQGRGGRDTEGERARERERRWEKVRKKRRYRRRRRRDGGEIEGRERRGEM